MNVVGEYHCGCDFEGHFGFDNGCGLAKAIYVGGFCEEWPAVKGYQSEEDSSPRNIGSAVVGHVGLWEEGYCSVPG
jgi:hypothetical protein